MSALQIVGTAVGALLIFNVYFVLVCLMVWRLKTKRRAASQWAPVPRIRPVGHRERKASR